jgi:hypothetical protein
MTWSFFLFYYILINNKKIVLKFKKSQNIVQELVQSLYIVRKHIFSLKWIAISKQLGAYASHSLSLPNILKYMQSINNNLSHFMSISIFLNKYEYEDKTILYKYQFYSSKVKCYPFSCFHRYPIEGRWKARISGRQIKEHEPYSKPKGH